MSHACILISTEHACIESATCVCACVCAFGQLKSVRVFVQNVYGTKDNDRTIYCSKPNKANPACGRLHFIAVAVPQLTHVFECVARVTAIALECVCVCFKRSITLFKWNAPPPRRSQRARLHHLARHTRVSITLTRAI